MKKKIIYNDSESVYKAGEKNIEQKDSSSNIKKKNVKKNTT